MSRINKSLDEEKTTQMLVIGTENGDVLFIESSGNAVASQLKVDSVPVQIECEGQYSV